ncbi:MAG: hypothetical protein CM1200mP2_44310 [Planctomycetaceae bacterium]|nr:MAG: hypothetical protein CM1200mP2_44310 [Planctomycetaceae bacterium]
MLGLGPGENELFLVMGASLVVHPAAGMPQLALQQGGRLVIINATETPYDDAADLLIRAPLGETLSAVDRGQKLRDPGGGEMSSDDCKRFIEAGDIEVEELPWGPHEWLRGQA